MAKQEERTAHKLEEKRLQWEREQIAQGKAYMSAPVRRIVIFLIPLITFRQGAARMVHQEAHGWKASCSAAINKLDCICKENKDNMSRVVNLCFEQEFNLR